MSLVDDRLEPEWMTEETTDHETPLEDHWYLLGVEPEVRHNGGWVNSNSDVTWSSTGGTGKGGCGSGDKSGEHCCSV